MFKTVTCCCYRQAGRFPLSKGSGIWCECKWGIGSWRPHVLKSIARSTTYNALRVEVNAFLLSRVLVLQIRRAPVVTRIQTTVPGRDQASNQEATSQ